MPKANLGDCEIYFEEHGEGEPLLLVSGLGGVASYWKPNLPALASRYRVVLHDHRGTGASTHSRMKYSVDQMTDDLVRLMDSLKIERAHLVGQSTGGAIGQTLAITRPERVGKLVLAGTWPKADPYFLRLFEARKELLFKAGIPAYIRALPVFLYPAWWVSQNIEVIEAREKVAIPASAPAEVIAARIDAICAFDRSGELGKIRAKTLVICAKDDIITPAYFSEELARRIPNATLQLLERGGHCASEAAKEDFERAVLAFLGKEQR
ncbi:MAG TPA: pyrimidine utilization protein D [Burkholderiales bacterium]|nr:pyrimidine utilization protein D [Burkholderiales bacterium]